VSLRRGFRPRLSSGRLLACLLLAITPTLRAQPGSAERAFSQSKATIEGAVKSMSTSLSGRLPTLDGFAVPEPIPSTRISVAIFRPRCRLHRLLPEDR